MNILAFLSGYTIVRRDSIAGYNLALSAARDTIAAQDVKLTRALLTQITTATALIASETRVNIAEQQAAAARAQLKIADQYATTLERRAEKAEADSEASRAEIAALRAKVETADAVLTAVRADLDDARIQLSAVMGERDNALARMEAMRAQAARAAPPVFAVPYAPIGVRTVEQVIEAALLPDFITGDKPRPSYTDATYNSFYPLDVVEYCAWWRANLMPPARGEESDCDNRAVDFAADLHRWSGFTLQVGIGLGTFAWALVDGQPYPHYVGLVVDPDARLWILDPAFLDRPEPWTPERVKLQSVPLY